MKLLTSTSGQQRKAEKVEAVPRTLEGADTAVRALPQAHQGQSGDDCHHRCSAEAGSLHLGINRKNLSLDPI
jgi:hypothetical protein